MPRNTDTRAATAARTRAKHLRWAKEMISAGFFVMSPEAMQTITPQDGAEMLATNLLGETYRVADMSDRDHPILAGTDGAEDWESAGGIWLYSVHRRSGRP